MSNIEPTGSVVSPTESDQPNDVAPSVQPFLLRHSARTEDHAAEEAGRDILETRYLQRPAGRIAYSLLGNGPLVICIPGFGEVRSVYRHLASSLADAGFKVAAMDRRGHGESDATFDSHDDGAIGTDIIALTETLGGPAILIGNSIGAGAACWVAAEAPALASGLVLLSPLVRTPDESLFKTLVLRVTALPRRVFHKARGDSRGETVASLDKANVPTLIVMGDMDMDFPDPEAEARWIAEKLRGKVMMVPGAGHYLQSDFSDLVTPAVVEFVRRLSPSAT